jgi:hypothetical protein
VQVLGADVQVVIGVDEFAGECAFSDLPNLLHVSPRCLTNRYGRRLKARLTRWDCSARQAKREESKDGRDRSMVSSEVQRRGSSGLNRRAR